jgi:hypothetical protein
LAALALLLRVPGAARQEDAPAGRVKNRA